MGNNKSFESGVTYVLVLFNPRKSCLEQALQDFYLPQTPLFSSFFAMQAGVLTCAEH
jgi:hypothetical protein